MRLRGALVRGEVKGGSFLVRHEVRGVPFVRLRGALPRAPASAAFAANFYNNCNDFNSILDYSDLARNIITWVITIGTLLTVLIGFLFVVKKAPKLLLLCAARCPSLLVSRACSLLVVINFFVFLTILDFTIHAGEKVGADDICAEITRPNGLFQLFTRLPPSALPCSSPPPPSATAPLRWSSSSTSPRWRSTAWRSRAAGPSRKVSASCPTRPGPSALPTPSLLLTPLASSS